MGNCAEMVAAYDRYIEKHPDQSTPYASLVSKDMPSIKLLGDNHKDDCAFHALQMAFELMGGFEKTSVRLQELPRRISSAWSSATAVDRGDLSSGS